MMVRTMGCAVFLLAAICGVALADTRVRSVLYDQSVVVPVVGREGFESAILFGDNEKIENIAVGDSLAWQVTPNKRANVVFLKPILAGARTNMTVVTDKRVYMFDLLPSSKQGQVLYSLTFTYPPPPPAPAVQPAPPQSDVAARPSDLNFAWEQKGAKALLPTHVFDDGHSIYLKLAHGAAVPAILMIGPDGSEGPVNFTVRGDTIVVDGVVSRLVLRSGEEAAMLVNTKPATSTADALAARVRATGR